MPRLRGKRISLRGSAAIVLEAVAAGPEDTFAVVFHGEREGGRVMLIDGEWHWSLRGGGSGYAASRAKALSALARAWGRNGGGDSKVERLC
jgi:hypothetical protein